MLLSDTLKDKLYILIFYSLWSTGFSFTEKMCRILVKRIAVRVDGVKYALLDPECLFIVSLDYEAPIWNYLKPRREDVFVDIGAHIGKYTLQVAKIVKDEGLVIAIEPNPKTYQILRRNIKLNNFKNIIALNIVAWSCSCKLKLYISHKKSAISSVKFKRNNYIYVHAEALDDILDELKVRCIHWIKIDAEGAEYEILRGMERVLLRWKPRIITAVRKKDMQAIKRFLNKIGYKTISIPISHNPDQIYMYCY